MMDARQAVREAMMAERKAGHWADPSVDDDRHDETSLFGRGETTDSETWNNRSSKTPADVPIGMSAGFFRPFERLEEP